MQKCIATKRITRQPALTHLQRLAQWILFNFLLIHVFSHAMKKIIFYTTIMHKKATDSTQKDKIDRQHCAEA